MKFTYLGSALVATVLMWGCQDGKKSQDAEGEDLFQEETETPDAVETREPSFQQEQPEAAEVSDEELEKFVNVMEEAQVLNQEIQGEMASAVEGEGMDIQRFMTIQQASQNPQIESDATEEELEKVESAMDAIQKKQLEAEQKMQKVIEEEGLTETRYQEIGMALQTNPELQERFQAVQQAGE